MWRHCIVIMIILSFMPIAYSQKRPLSINSHEYKILLNVELFATQEEPVTVANQFLSALEQWIKKNDDRASVTKHFTPKKEYLVNYYDTLSTCQFKNSGYIFRVKELNKNDQKKYEVTLKYRTNALVEFSDFIKKITVVPQAKQELDAQLDKLTYSYSEKFTTLSKPDLQNISQLTKFKLIDHLINKLDITYNTSIKSITEQPILERNLGGAVIKFNDESYKLNMALWYLNDLMIPDLVEFSFKVETNQTEPSATPTKLLSLISTMPDWYNQKLMTKTEYAYQYLDCGDTSQ